MDETTPATPATMPEVWTFGGSRIGQAGKRIHAWVPPGGDELWFAAKGSYSVGSEYDVEVRRDGERVTRHGTPVYRGRHADEAVRLALDVQHRAAEVQLRVVAAERADKRNSPLDAALEPLCAAMRDARSADRDALLAYILRRLARA